MAWNIDPAHSLIEFSVKHMMFTTVRGRFKSFDATLELDPDNVENSHAEGTIDVTSIDTGEADRDEHLRSADFFDVENFPTMHFESTKIEEVGNGEYKVYGDLTIKGTTREIVFDVTSQGHGQDPWGNQRWGFGGEATLNRKDFGLNWNVALEAGGWLVGDEIKISAELQVVQEQEQAETEAVAA